MNMQSESIAKLAEALAKAQGEIKGATKDAQNPHFRSKYADLSSVWEACRSPLSSNGLSVIQTTDGEGERVEVITTLAHSSGEWIRGRLVMRPVKADPQGIGSALTYARRYALAAMVGVAPEDDDGEGATRRGDNGKRDNPPPPPSREEPTANEGKRSEADPARAEAFVNALRVQLSTCRDLADVDALVKKHAAALAKLRATFSDLWEQAEEAVSSVRLEIMNDPVEMRNAG